jgi:hypothetical protein
VICRDLSIEQRLLILSEAMQHRQFNMDTDRVRAMLVEAADTIRDLRPADSGSETATLSRPDNSSR